jgi:hypothetical protein
MSALEVMTTEGQKVDVSCWRVDQHQPWLLEVWEPLTTKVPNPNLAQPHCCYINTVIFYVRPYVVRPWHHFWECRGKRRAEKPGHHYEEWGRVKTVLVWDRIFSWNGDEFICGGGRVVWKNNRWYMRRWARRRQKEN